MLGHACVFELCAAMQCYTYWAQDTEAMVYNMSFRVCEAVWTMMQDMAQCHTFCIVARYALVTYDA